MQEEFEKKVQDRMLSFGMQPSPQVWDDIDAALGKRKHRRIFIGWWILLGLVIAGGGILFYQKDNILHNELNQQPVPVIDSAAHKNMAQTPGATIPGQAPAQTTEPATLIKPAEQPAVPPTANNTTQQNNRPVKSTGKPSSPATQAVASTVTSPVTTINAPGNNTIAINTNTGATSNLAASKTTNGQPASAAAATNAGVAETLPPLQATTVADSAAVIKQPAIDQPANTAISKPPIPAKEPVSVTPKTIASTRHQWFFTIGGGATQTTGNFDNSDKNSLNTPATNDRIGLLSSYYAAAAAQQSDVTKPKAGFHLFAGAAYQYKLDKQWRLTAGLQVAYATNTQQTGAYVTNDPIYVSTSFLQTNIDQTLQDGYYLAGRPGSTYNVVNKSWQLQVPLNAGYVINPRAKTKLLLNAGLSASWLLNSRWLIPDNRYGKLYYNKTILNSTAISWQAGPELELKNKWRFGLQYQQSFTTLAKGYVTPKLYWQNISLYAGIPLNITLKKAKK